MKTLMSNSNGSALSTGAPLDSFVKTNLAGLGWGKSHSPELVDSILLDDDSSSTLEDLEDYFGGADFLISNSLSSFGSFNMPKRKEEVISKPLQQWYGSVVLVGKTDFEARLTDPCNDQLDSEATVPFDLVAESDLPLLKKGATFYWNVVVEIEAGRKRVVSSLKFRRLPQISVYDKEQIAKTEYLLASIFNKK